MIGVGLCIVMVFLMVGCNAWVSLLRYNVCARILIAVGLSIVMVLDMVDLYVWVSELWYDVGASNLIVVELGIDIWLTCEIVNTVL